MTGANEKYTTKRYINMHIAFNRYVAYWPSVEPSIKRYTCVNKRKKQVHPVEDVGISPWPVDVVEFGADACAHRKQVDGRQLYNQVPQTAWVSWISSCSSSWRWDAGVRTSSRQKAWALRTYGWAAHQNAKEVLLWPEELGVNMWQSVSVSNSPLTHKKHQPFRIKCERYIFYKEVCSFVNRSRHHVSAYICMYMSIQ